MPLYTLRDVEVDFPFNAYQCQLDYMSCVIQALDEKKNALLESPTGTGKTLSLLCASLAWREHRKQTMLNAPEQIKTEPRHESHLVQGLREGYAELKAEQAKMGQNLPTIIYASRTHSQIKQVMKELSRTSYQPTVAVLGSRQQSCINRDVQNLPSTAANQACRALTMRRECRFQRNVEPYLKANPDTNATVMDIEDLYKFGSDRSICPYYLSREMAATADIVFMPYNYLLDPATRVGLGISWTDAILIFDEAHNVENVCTESASFDISATVLAGAIEEAGTAAELAMASAENAQKFIPMADSSGAMKDGQSEWKKANDMRNLQLVLKKLELEIGSMCTTISSGDKGRTFGGKFLFDLFKKINLTKDTWGEMYTIMEAATSLLASDAVQGQRRQGSRASSYRLHALQEMLTVAFSTLEPMCDGGEPRHAYYRMNVRLEQPRSGGGGGGGALQDGSMAVPSLGYWCFSPGLAMQSLAESKIRSIILTSGTLSPLSSFASELSISFPIQLENPHVIDPGQAWIGVVGKGPRGVTLNSSYQNRNNPEYKEDLGNSIVNFARIVPDGLLVFFPSYITLKQCIDFWKIPNRTTNTSIWERIIQYKAPVVEPRETSQFPEAVVDFKTKLESPEYRGAIFFAVCRGKASEGLDFSDSAGRAVIITGIPYAMKTDPKVQIKQDVLNEQRKAMLAKNSYHNKRKNSENSNNVDNNNNSSVNEPLSGDTWYVQQAIRAVNQAMGRVIRHRQDYGAIILCDERFNQLNVKMQLSKWLRDRVQTLESFGVASSELTKFFKAQAEAAKEGRCGDGGQKVIVGTIGPREAHQQMAMQRKGNMGAFQRIVTTNTSNGVSSIGVQLAHTVPAAADMVGLTELVGGSVLRTNQINKTGKEHNLNSDTDLIKGCATLSGLDEVLGVSNQDGHELLRVQKHPQHAVAASHLRPWERTALPAPTSTLNTTTNAGVHPLSGTRRLQRGGLMNALQLPVTMAQTANTVVGPAHKIKQHTQHNSTRGLLAPEKLAQRASRPLPPPAAVQKLHAEQQSQQQLQARTDGDATPEQTTNEDRLGDEHQERMDNNISRREREGHAVVTGKEKSKRKGNAGPSNQVSLISRLRAELPPDDCNQFEAALRQYQKDRDATKLLPVAAKILHYSERKSLLEAFRPSVPKDMQRQFQQHVLEATRQYRSLDNTINNAHYGSEPLPAPNPIHNQTGGVNNSVSVRDRGVHADPPAVKRGGFQAGKASSRTAPTPLSLHVHNTINENPPRGRIEAAKLDPSTDVKPLKCDICSKYPADTPHTSSCCQRFACLNCHLKSIALFRSCSACKKPLKKNMLISKKFI